MDACINCFYRNNDHKRKLTSHYVFDQETITRMNIFPILKDHLKSFDSLWVNELVPAIMASHGTFFKELTYKNIEPILVSIEPILVSVYILFNCKLTNLINLEELSLIQTHVKIVLRFIDVSHRLWPPRFFT